MQPENPDNRPSPNSNPTQPPSGNQDWNEQRREWREKRHHDPLRGIFWGLLLIMLGLIFLAWQQRWLSDDNWWQYLLVGLGVVFIIDGLVHYWNPAYHNYGFGRFIPGIILLFVGLAFIFNFSQWWPIILIAVGVVLLISFFFRRR